jgi:transcriptional regulator with XRE-family HTH domain
MTSPLLPNYLRANRKRLALSQGDVAFLLGKQIGAKISRYENFAQIPSLENALAFEIIYKLSASEIFGGLYAQMEKDIAARAKLLIDKNDPRSGGQAAKRRAALLELSKA